MSTQPIKLVCFDLGGVIVRIRRSWREACEAAGLDAPDGFDPAAHPEILSLIHHHQTGALTIDDYAREFCRCVDGSLKHLSRQDIITIHDTWILGEYEGVADVIDSIHAAGVVTATLSNTTAEHWKQLLQYPSIARIKHRWASHLLGMAKPDPAVYRAFEQQVGCAGNEILFFDDLGPNIAAAREIGWRAVQIDYAACTATQMAHTLERHGVRRLSA